MRIAASIGTFHHSVKMKNETVYVEVVKAPKEFIALFKENPELGKGIIYEYRGKHYYIEQIP